MEKKRVVVTGATGYIAGHVIDIFLKNGYLVTGTMRNATPQRQAKIKELYTHKDNLQLIEGDLLDPLDTWITTFEQLGKIDGVIHTASPFPSTNPTTPAQVITPAVEGTQKVVKAAYKTSVNRVVVTSSIAAVYSGHYDHPCFTEADWGDPNNCSVYEQSKILAEKYLWDLCNSMQEQYPEMVVTAVNPGLVIGPQINQSMSTSIGVVSRPMLGQVPGVPNLIFSIVDVRDVAQAHFNAFIQGIHMQRYIITNTQIRFTQLIQILQDEFNPQGYNIKNRRVCKCIVQFASIFDKSLKGLIKMIDKEFTISNQKSIKDLGMTYIPIQQSIIDQGYDLINRGVVPNKINKPKL